MQILHSVPLVGRGSGGVGTAALGMARAQLEFGMKAAIWCQGSPAESEEIAREWQLTDHIITYPTVGPWYIGYSPACERAARGAAGREFAVLHQHGIWMANSRLANTWRSAHQRPTVVAPHGALESVALQRSTWKKRLAMLGYEGQNLRQAACIQATAEPELTSIRRFGLRNPVALIPNSIPTSWLDAQGDAAGFRRQYGIPEDKRILLYLSRLHPIKGLPLLLEAVAEARADLAAWRLVIVGPDEVGHRHELEQQAALLQILDLVQFIGPVFGTGKRDAFAAAEVFVLPTHSEGFGIAIAEALGAGVPAITTHGAPWAELQTDHCGWWVPIEAAAIAEAVRAAVRLSPAELAAMGERGRKLVARRYTWSVVAGQSQRLYEWLLGQASRPDFVFED